MEAKLFHSLTPTKAPLLPTPWKNPWLTGTRSHLSIRLKPLILGPIQSSNNNANANETTNPVTPPPPEAVEIRFRRRSSKRRNRDGDRDGDGQSSSPSPAKKEKKKKKWEEMSTGEKALELYVGEKGALYWLNKLAYASIYVIIGAWILFRFVGPALNLYQLDAPPLSPESILKG